MDLINDLIAQAVASPWLFPVLFVATVIDGFFPPVPSESVLVAAAAVLAMTDATALVPLCLLAAAAATIGDNIAFWVGRRVGTRRFRWMRRPRVAATFDHARRAMDHSAAVLVLGARYVPVGRVAVNTSAGAVGYPWRRFLPLSALAGLCWSVFSITIGLVAGTWVRDQPLLAALLGVAIALLIGVIVDRVAALGRRARRRRLDRCTADATASAPDDAEAPVREQRDQDEPVPVPMPQDERTSRLAG
ncbi:VTT domain-containing protein [Microbacterium esteraromaticum]|uniref:DedA family protein n=1 Tax=Microbacterium esteraromaticum TaxID=57043 RepID=UPI001C948902|nr:VTT domain-containing protein [Microbacterium esteraromaticum]MBY6061088.1 VTT domain-containing protein [Microbacterium esteraromaticum]